MIVEIAFVPILVFHQNDDDSVKILMIIKDISTDICVRIMENSNLINRKIITSITHELRTPLNCAMNMLDLIKEYVSEKIVEKYHTPCYNSLKILFNNLNDFLDFVSLENNEFSLNLLEFSLKDLIENTLSIFTFQINNRDLKLKIIYDEIIPIKINSDPNRIRQILINLLNNAIRYTRKGSITIKTRYNKNLNTIKISVEDTGIGMEKEQKKNIGKLNIHDSNKMVGGLGMTICCQIAEFLGPNLKSKKGLFVESEKGAGTTFSFFIANHSKFEEPSEDLADRLIDKQYFEEKYIDFINSHNYDNKIFLNQLNEKQQNNEENLNNINNNNNEEEEMFSKDYLKNTNLVYSKRNEEDKNEDLKEKKQFLNKNSLTPIKNKHESFTSYKSINNEEQTKNIDNFLANKKCDCPDILIVDDTDFNIFTLKILCEKCNFIVDTAISGDIAIQLCIKKFNNKCCNCYKIIFMDIDMPVKNGYQTTEEIKDFFDDNYIKTKIIACTAFTSKEIIARCFEVGMNDYLTKPVNINAIRMAISDHLLE